MARAEPDTEALLQRAAQGERAARSQLLDRHYQRLRRMVALRLDPRVAPRVDPSDVLQESLAEAVQQMPITCAADRCRSIRGCGRLPGNGLSMSTAVICMHANAASCARRT